MSDIALDTRTRDLRLATAGAFTDLVPVEGAEEVAQMVGIHLRTWIGEWFLDSAHGVPYLEHILGHARRAQMVEAVLRDQILSVRGVTGIPSLALTLDRRQRTMRADFVVTTPRGDASGGLRIA